MARLAGIREGDEREQRVTGQAARYTFLLTLAVEIALILMTLTTFHVVRNADRHGYVSIGFKFDSQNLDIYGRSDEAAPVSRAPLDIAGNMLPPNFTLPMAILILVQLVAFRIFSSRRYQGLECD